jgi:Fe-S oxidoreductase
MCVGCNRCGRVCLAGINPPDIIEDLKTEDPA